MNLQNYYWYFTSALTPKFCDDLIAYANKQKEVMAMTGNFENKENLTKQDFNNLQKIRKSDLVWLNEAWIYKEIQPYVHIANKNAGWNFEWNNSEHCQFTKYKLNHFYNWHCDSWNKPYERKDTNSPDHGKIRKLSMTCQLTDGSEYEGGELEFDFRNYEPHLRDESQHRVQCKEILPKGSIIVFPSFVWHRVKPIKKGVRYSLVSWHCGNPYK